MSTGPGCTITASARSSKTPALSSKTFPPPHSSAGVTDPGQCVVFGADPDSQRTTAEVGTKRGVQTARGRGDLKTPLGHQFLRLGATAMLGEGQLRLGMNRMRQLDEVGAETPHRVVDAIQRRG